MSVLAFLASAALPTDPASKPPMPKTHQEAWPDGVQTEIELWTLLGVISQRAQKYQSSRDQTSKPSMALRARYTYSVTGTTQRNSELVPTLAPTSNHPPYKHQDWHWGLNPSQSWDTWPVLWWYLHLTRSQCRDHQCWFPPEPRFHNTTAPPFEEMFCLSSYLSPFVLTTIEQRPVSPVIRRESYRK